MKEWECVRVGHEVDVAKTIVEWEKQGWRLHTYQATSFFLGLVVNHYLLFVREV